MDTDGAIGPVDGPASLARALQAVQGVDYRLPPDTCHGADAWHPSQLLAAPLPAAWAGSGAESLNARLQSAPLVGWLGVAAFKPGALFVTPALFAMPPPAMSHVRCGRWRVRNGGWCAPSMSPPSSASSGAATGAASAPTDGRVVLPLCCATRCPDQLLGQLGCLVAVTQWRLGVAGGPSRTTSARGVLPRWVEVPTTECIVQLLPRHTLSDNGRGALVSPAYYGRFSPFVSATDLSIGAQSAAGVLAALGSPQAAAGDGGGGSTGAAAAASLTPSSSWTVAELALCDDTVKTFRRKLLHVTGIVTTVSAVVHQSATRGTPAVSFFIAELVSDSDEVAADGSARRGCQSGSQSPAAVHVVFSGVQTLAWRPFLCPGRRYMISKLQLSNMKTSHSFQGTVLRCTPTSRVFAADNAAACHPVRLSLSQRHAETADDLESAVTPPRPRPQGLQQPSHTSSRPVESRVITYEGTVSRVEPGLYVELDNDPRTRVWVTHFPGGRLGCCVGSRIVAHNVHPLVLNDALVGLGACMNSQVGNHNARAAVWHWQLCSPSPCRSVVP